MTAYTGTQALPPLLAGDVPSAATDWAAIVAALHALTDAWSTYNPVWTTTGTAPVPCVRFQSATRRYKPWLSSSQ